MNDKDSGSSFAIGFLIGAIAGVAIGLLYAPKSGIETRAMLREKAGEIKEKAGEIKEKAGEVTEKARGAAIEAGKRVKDKIGSKEE